MDPKSVHTICFEELRTSVVRVEYDEGVICYLCLCKIKYQWRKGKTDFYECQHQGAVLDGFHFESHGASTKRIDKMSTIGTTSESSLNEKVKAKELSFLPVLYRQIGACDCTHNSLRVFFMVQVQEYH